MTVSVASTDAAPVDLQPVTTRAQAIIEFPFTCIFRPINACVSISFSFSSSASLSLSLFFLSLPPSLSFSLSIFLIYSVVSELHDLDCWPTVAASKHCDKMPPSLCHSNFYCLPLICVVRRLFINQSHVRMPQSAWFVGHGRLSISTIRFIRPIICYFTTASGQ